MLHVIDAHVYYGHIHALRGISLEVHPGKIVSLLGANGAGKTTTLNMISRLVDLKSGECTWNGKSLVKFDASEVVREGIIHCPENRRVFPLFTVEENLIIGRYQHKDKNSKQALGKVYEYFPRLKERKNQQAGTLSGGEQQMLAIGRALMGNPKVLLLDEPSLGIAPILVKEIFNIIKNINDEGTSILLVEQNAYIAMEVSDYSYVLENGRIALEGNSQQLKQNEEIKKLYLGR